MKKPIGWRHIKPADVIYINKDIDICFVKGCKCNNAIPMYKKNQNERMQSFKLVEYL